MARNIGNTCCPVCDGTIVLEEAARPIRPQECAGLTEYVGKLTVANARCGNCGSLYLAWVRIEGSHGKVAKPCGSAFVDLSFRTSFNSEPAAADLPSLNTLRELADRNRRQSIENMQASIAKMQADIAGIEKAMGGPCFWEVYLK